ncbi:MAG: hypothetical protein WKF47_16525 [Geodermatophilaceae bacterium]
MHVRGYKEEGTTTTPFDMVMLNDLDRFHLVMDVIDRVPAWQPRPRTLRQQMADARLPARAYTREHGEDDAGDRRLDLAVAQADRVRACWSSNAGSSQPASCACSMATA